MLLLLINVNTSVRLAVMRTELKSVVLIKFIIYVNVNFRDKIEQDLYFVNIIHIYDSSDEFHIAPKADPIRNIFMLVTIFIEFIIYSHLY